MRFRNYTIVFVPGVFTCIYCKFGITTTYEWLLRNLLSSEVLLFLAFAMGGNQVIQEVELIINHFIVLRPKSLSHILQQALKPQPLLCILVPNIPVDHLSLVAILFSGFEVSPQSWHIKIFFSWKFGYKRKFVIVGKKE